MSSFTLDDIRAAAEVAYGHCDIPLGTEDGFVTRLLNPMSITQAKRDRLVALQSELTEDGADHVALLEEALKLVAANDSAGNRLVEAIGGDLPVLMTTFQKYSEGTQSGEASASAS